MIVIQALDRAGKRWFWNADGAWQEKRDSRCHFSTIAAADKAYKSATTRDRFTSAEDRMEEIEMSKLL